MRTARPAGLPGLPSAAKSSFGRVVEGYQVLRDSLCDPKLSYLDVKPEIKAVEVAANDARLALAKLWNDMRSTDRYFIDFETQELCMHVLGLTSYTQLADEVPDAAAKEITDGHY